MPVWIGGGLVLTWKDRCVGEECGWCGRDDRVVFHYNDDEPWFCNKQHRAAFHDESLLTDDRSREAKNVLRKSDRIAATAEADELAVRRRNRSRQRRRSRATA